jgi:O-antigen chain-terminating methyltransferase
MLSAAVRRRIHGWLSGKRMFQDLYRPEIRIIRDEIERSDGRRWGGFASPADTVGLSERVVEIPWVLSRYRGEEDVLDIGTSNAPDVYLSSLTRLNIPNLVGLDLSGVSVAKVEVVRGDMTQMPFGHRAFGLILCISTLEHCGKDNTQYGVSSGTATGDAVTALAEMARTLKPGGRLILTLPYGRYEDLGSFIQYDQASWERLIATSTLTVVEREIFEYSSEGWHVASDERGVASTRYERGQEPRANAVLCAVLMR